VDLDGLTHCEDQALVKTQTGPDRTGPDRTKLEAVLLSDNWKSKRK